MKLTPLSDRVVLKMTEAEAHRFIEKQAMDRCTAKKEIALGIIKTYQ